jgi:hypothetical protein
MATSQATSTLITTAELKGTKARNFQDEQIGEIDELLIEPDSGAVRFAVLSVGGFLGLGTTRVAVPWRALGITRSRDGTITIVLDATKERLEKAPRVEGTKNYERLYVDEVAEPIFVYWEVDNT